MSNLAQAHVTFLSKRCLSSPIWRKNAWNRSSSTSPTERSAILDSLSQDKSKSTIRIENVRSLRQTRASTSMRCETNTPDESQKRRAESHTHSNDILNRILSVEHLDKPLPLSSFQRFGTFPNENERLCAMNSLSYKKQSSYCHLESNSFNNYGYLVKLRSQQYSGQREEDSGRGKKHHHRSQYIYPVLLSALGIFKPYNSDTIEEERKKLSDEQKLKKMTPFELITAKGVLHMCDQEYDKAEVLFHEALHMAQFAKNSDQETLVLNLLATSYFDSGQLEKAENLFIDLIKRLIAAGVDSTDASVLELSLKLSSIYSKSAKTHNKALKGFEFVISTLMHQLGDILKNLEIIKLEELSEKNLNDLALLGWSYDWFAKHLIGVNDHEGAVEMLKSALEISSKILGPLHDQTLILLNDVGTTLAINNFPEKGRTFIRKAVEGAIEGKSKELASFYVNLGLVNLQLRKLNEAKRYCEYSNELALKNRDKYNNSEILKISQDCLNEVKYLHGLQTHH